MLTKERVWPIAETEIPTDHLSNIKTLTGFPDYYSPLFFPTLEACKPFFLLLLLLLFNQEFALFQGTQETP